MTPGDGALAALAPPAPSALLALLDPARGALLPPIRAEIFGPQRFAEHGRSLAETHEAVRATWRSAGFFPRVQSNIRVLREAQAWIAAQAGTGHSLSPAAEWLLDNFHLIESQLDAIRTGLPRRYFRGLPVLQAAPLAGLPRVYGVAWAFVAHTDGAFDEDLLVHFLRAYQGTRALSLGEVWALPTTLRVVMLENLRRLAERVATHKAARELANRCCDRPAMAPIAALDEALAALERRGAASSFLLQVALRLNDRPLEGRLAGPDLLGPWLAQHLPDAAATQAQQLADQTADNLSVSNAVSALRAIDGATWPDIVARTSLLMQQMLGSPLFEAEATLTRDQTLHGIEHLARRCRRSEAEVATALLEAMAGASGEAATASHWLRGDGRPVLARGLGLRAPLPWRRLALPVYLSALAGGTVWLVAWVMRLTAGADVGELGTLALPAALLAWALAWLPASEAVVAVVNRLVGESIPPLPLPRLALLAGIPPEHRVMVVIPAMLFDQDSGERLAHRLLLHHLANPERQAQFALLTDWADADAETTAGDAALLRQAQAAVAALNLSHPGAEGDAPRFILLHRPRRWSVSEQAWIGWERKRGKLEELLAALATGHSAAFVDLGETSRIAAHLRYVVTLDSDTELPPGRLRELVGVAAHPANEPRLDATGRRVLQGYAILQPRLVTPLPRRDEATPFHWMFAGQCGIDPYSAASSEVYQDLFAEGSFTGKGLLHVAACHAVLGGRLPVDRILSHDLIEGALARCATLSDVTLVESAPFHADVAASRVHRWMRGDWQLLPLLLSPRRWPLGALNRWKLFDNLRRSLVAPASLGLLLLALASGVVHPALALALVLAALTAGPLIGAFTGLLPSRGDIAFGHFFFTGGTEIARAALGGLWLLAQLLHQAPLALDAVVRSLYRRFISHRRLLQWTTAATAERQADKDLASLWRRHVPSTGVALLLLVLLVALDGPSPVLSVLLCLAWAASPLWTWWASRPHTVVREPPPTAAQRAELHGIARDTWRLFERCVGPEDRHLPPDNLQTLPHDAVAHRTSPTNIGLYLLSAACARSFGWIGTVDWLARTEATLGSLDVLERHRGHFLNWYDTRSGTALRPMYVSTVDSGNFSAHLLAVAQACRAAAREPLDPAASARALLSSRARLAPLLAARPARVPAQREQLRWCLADHRATRRSAQQDQRAAGGMAGGVVALSARLLMLADRLEALAAAPDFSFLYHRQRRLFHIGYRVGDQQLDPGHFDLLASEARLTSLLAIAQGTVQVGHWSALGRPFFAIGRRVGLRSWSGSMFEYLMPGLVLNEPPGSALDAACRTALDAQIAHAAAHDLPWGCSESAHCGRDQSLAYQYAPQGVPALALRRTPAGEAVVAPYATALAAMLSPQRACANFAALQALGARGRYGFIEALDFSPARQVGPSRFTPVATYMAHHQGMSIVALANLLLGGVAQRWGMASPSIEAVASLLQERVPREVPKLPDQPASPVAVVAGERTVSVVREVRPGASAIEPTQLLSNGAYSVTLRANGAGWSRRGTAGIGRFRDDALRDAHGSFLYMRWDRQPRLVSLTQHPAPDPAAQYTSSFHADRVVFDADWPELRARVTVWVSPEDDVEFRQVELSNLSDRPLDIELISAFEPTLTDPRADEAHPAFSNLFIQAAWQAATQSLQLTRRPRLATEVGLHAAHFLAGGDPHLTGLRVQTDRRAWRGRNTAASQPAADFDTAPLAGGGPDQVQDTGLDPMCALSMRLHIAPRGKARLSLATAAADDAPTLAAIVDKYRQSGHVERASLMSATLAGIRLASQPLGAADLAAVQSLCTALVFNLDREPLRTPGAADLPPAECDRRRLWRFGISGDRPILLVSAGPLQGLGLVRALAQALRLWAWAGIACDLVVVNAELVSYLMPLQQELALLSGRHATECGVALTSLTVLRVDGLSADESATLHSLARVRMAADGRSLAHHVQAWLERHEAALESRPGTATTPVGLWRPPPAQGAAPVGQFDSPSGEFRFDAGAGQRTPRPWINVLANPGFGAHLSEAGGGHSWALNSRLNQITPWSNDPVADTPGEWVLLQDLATGAVWSLAPSAWGDPDVVYHVSHGQGTSHISHRRAELAVQVSWCVDPLVAVKQLCVTLHNHGTVARRLRLICVAEWIMGADRGARATVHTALMRQRLPVGKLSALLGTQREASAGFGGGTAFLAMAGSADEPEDWTCDRRELFDARGAFVMPDHLGQRSGSGLDPCAALGVRLLLAGGQRTERVFLLGHAESPDAARQLAATAAIVPAAQRLAAAREPWNRLLGATTVQTPDPLFDVMVNRWLLYQTVACRLWAKAGFYQAGGATGFRDQLQDSLALGWAAPGMLREQILRCAGRQFPEGDVQHWWHSPGGAGVRTHFSDDLLWLPHACIHHRRVTGDLGLLDERLPFLQGGRIPEGAEDLYETPGLSADDASVYEHAARAIDHSLRVGVHGLPLMGSGDWNDGMNRVGHEGRGESVWLGFFLCSVVAGFAPIARQRGDVARAARWEAAATGWGEALRGVAWDGAWFTRAYFDDGEPLGSSRCTEARIDLIAQAWSVLSGVATPAQQQRAMASAEALLIDDARGLVRLLDPPLVDMAPSAGYIQAYPPGVRENGGQYSHAGVWALMAQARLAATAPDPAAAADAVYRSFQYLSPAHRASDPTWGAVYGTEPYAVAGDVESQPPWTGQGGWSWYTGAAAWLHRAAVESMFGLQLEAESLSFTPCLPSHWARAELSLSRGERRLRFVLLRGSEAELDAAAGELGATRLAVGERLRWFTLAGASCHLLALPVTDAL